MVDDQRRFADRYEAGRVLAERLASYAGSADVLVLALPRGGVPVASEVAAALGVPLDVFVVRKLGTPGHSELAMGAIASGGVRVINDEIVRGYGISQAEIERAVLDEEQELARREAEYRGGLPPPDVTGRIVILVDDGLATGSTMRAAVQAVRQHNPARVIVGVPVGTRSARADLLRVADVVVCVRMPEPFSAVGQWYVDFEPTTDQEVRKLLGQDRDRSGSE